MFVTNPIGILGEQTAAQMLQQKGYKILERNWRMGHLEMDLIAANRSEIIFAEVKARTTMFANKRAEQYVDDAKKRRMIVAANAYIKYYQIEQKPRFDIFGIQVDETTNQVIDCTHLENAFYPTLKTISTGSYNGQWRWGHRTKSIGRRHK